MGDTGERLARASSLSLLKEIVGDSSLDATFFLKYKKGKAAANLGECWNANAALLILIHCLFSECVVSGITFCFLTKNKRAEDTKNEGKNPGYRFFSLFPRSPQRYDIYREDLVPTNNALIQEDYHESKH